MRAELVRADEVHAIRGAIDEWQAAGAVDVATAERLREPWPDDRRRARLAFRLLFFGFTLFAGGSLWGFGSFFLSFGGGFDSLPHVFWLALLAGGAGWGAAHCIGPQRMRGFGVEEGLAALALGWGAAALGLLFGELGLPGRGIVTVVGLGVAVAAASAASSWGLAGSGLVAAGGLLAALGPLPAARLAWIAGALVAAPLARRRRADERAPLAHRRRAGEVYLVALLAFWFASHPSQLAGELLGGGRSWQADHPELALVATAGGWVALVLLPLLLLVAGWRRRDRLELGLGALAALAAAVTAADALDLGPPWALLTGGGAVLLLLGFALRGRMAAQPGRIWRGFTDRELLGASAEGSWLELAATLAAFTPAPRAAPRPAGFEGEGGEFGGGGATAGF